MAEGNIPVHDAYEEDPLDEHVQDPGDPDGVVAAEKRLQWQEKHPNPSVTPQTEYKPKRRWPWVLLILVAVVAATFGAYWFGSHEAAKQQNASKPPVTANTPQQTAQSATEQTKQYNSTNYGLGFAYPTSWSVSDTTAKLTVTSPATELMTAVGSKVEAHVVVTIQNQQTNIPGFPSGGAVAALGSDILTYKQPSAVQRGQTYISYLSYTEPNGLDTLYVTGNNGYQQGQMVPMSDVVQGNPLISVGFEKCANDTCSGGTVDSVTLQASSWKSTSVNKDIANLIESIVVNSD